MPLINTEATCPDPNPTQKMDEIGMTEKHTKSGPQDQAQYNTQAKHFEIDEDIYNTPQEQEMYLHDEEEYNHLYAETPA